MSANTAQHDVKPSNNLNLFKWFFVILLVSATVVANQYFNDSPLLYRVLVVTFVLGVSLYVSLTTAQGKVFLTLIKESLAEIKKVVWPTKQETTQTTLIVVAIVILMALLLWAIDSLFSWVISFIIESL